jgi:hypothetical protein
LIDTAGRAEDEIGSIPNGPVLEIDVLPGVRTGLEQLHELGELGIGDRTAIELPFLPVTRPRCADISGPDRQVRWQVGVGGRFDDFDLGRADLEGPIRISRRSVVLQLSSANHRQESSDDAPLGLDESDAGRPSAGSEVLVVFLVDGAQVLGLDSGRCRSGRFRPQQPHLVRNLLGRRPVRDPLNVGDIGIGCRARCRGIRRPEI